MNDQKLKANIWKLYLIKGLGSFMLVLPVIVLFLQENGLSMQQIFLLQSLYAVSVIFLEIPTGFFSDVFGRKKSIIMGGFLATLGFAIYSQSFGFWSFLLGEIALGVSACFISGADSAIIYDTLLELGEENDYKKVEGRRLGLGIFLEAIASIAGGVLALISLRFPLYCDVVITSFIVPVALTLVEPKRYNSEAGKADFKNMFKLIKFSLYESKEIKWIIFYSAIVSVSTLTMFWFIQPYLLATNVPLGFFGVALAILLLVAAFFSWNVYRVEEFFGKRNILILLIFLPAIGYFLLSSFWFFWSGIFIFLFYVVRGINNPVTLDYINGLIDSNCRATILSIKNLVARLIFSVIGPVIGWVNDVFSLRLALQISGLTFFVLGIISLIFMYKNKVI